jgi:plasmid stability protein
MLAKRSFMPQVLVRDLRPETVSRLKARAKAHRRSLQAELKHVLENASRQGGLDGRALADRVRRRLAGRKHSDSVDLIAADRAR